MVEIKSSVVESIGKLHLRTSTSTVELTPLRQECSKEPTPHAADSIVGRSLALFVHLSTTSPSVRRCILEHALRWSSSPWHRCPITASSTNSADTSLLDRIPRVLSILLAGVATSPALSHWTCPTSDRLSSPFLLKHLRAVLTIQSQCKRLSSMSGRVVADAMSAEGFSTYSLHQHWWGELLWKMEI